LIAIIGKILGCGLGAYLYGQSLWESAIIGSGMNGRGAVEMVIAAVVIELSSLSLLTLIYLDSFK